MTRAADWYGFHAQIDLIDTPTALQAALADPLQRWYGLRRVQSLAASGALVGASFNPNVHPRGKDGKFIERFGWVRWFDPGTLNWKSGWVSDIDPNTGQITVRSAGDKVEFPNAKNLYSRPKPKALLDLPDPTSGKLPDKFVKVGGQGGSNPGGLYQIDGSFADGSPDISKRSKMFSALVAMRQPGTTHHLGDSFQPDGAPEAVAPNDVNVAMVPRIDGTKGRYDVVQRFGTGDDWYRVPASGQMTEDDLMRPDLKVSAVDVFGEPGSDRRQRVVADPGTQGITRGSAFDANDLSAMVQQTGSPLPAAGDRYYVKKMNLPERARSEALANDFYELLGIPVPDVAVGTDGTTISSKLVGDTVTFDPNNPAHIAAAQKGFVGDAWLSNWDVIGLTFDNIQIDADGNAWRIDAGGSLEWRAQGKPKGAMFGNQAGELDSLRNPAINPQSSKVYGAITQAQLVEQATVLQSITPVQIQALADAHDMSHVGPVLIARRKSVLDQVGIVDPPPTIPETTPAPQTVFNPVEAVQQMGTPPTVAVHNYTLGIDAIPATTIDSTDWGDNYLAQHGVFKKDGDLWTYDSGIAQTDTGVHAGLFRNAFTGERKQMSIYDGQDKFLDTYTTDNVDTLIENATPSRDLAIAEIVARTNDTPLNQLSHFNVNHDDDPAGMQYSSFGAGNYNTLQTALDRGRLGPLNAEGGADRPIRNGDDDTLWEITAAGPNGLKLTRRGGTPDPASWKQNLIALDADNFAANGPWFIPGNDTTAAVWKSKYDPADVGDGTTDASLGEQSAIAAKQQQVDDLLTLLDPADDPSLDMPGDDGTADVVGVPTSDAPVATSTDADLEALIASEEAIAAEMAAAGPTSSQKVTNDVADSLGAGPPSLSTEMALSDQDAIEAKFLNKSVVVLPIEAHDNPAWEAVDLGTANGLGTVTSVETKKVYVPGSGFQDVLALKVSKPYGGFSWVVGGENSKFPKVVIPVETVPAPQQVTFKQNGDIFINGEKVGHYWKPYTHPGGTTAIGSAYYTYSGVIDGDHSLTGKPMQFSGNKQAELKNAGASLVVPIAAKPTKPKSTKVIATEQQIKHLNLQLAGTAASIEGIQQQLEDLAKAKPTSGNPLNDGTFPAKGDWVFSVKDGSYAQVKQVELQFGAKHKQNPADFLRVTIAQPDGTTKTTIRSRNTLVSAAGPGEAPFVMQTKAQKSAAGSWFGPGSKVIVSGAGSLGTDVTVLDTTSDGKVKVLHPDGTQKWVSTASVAGVSTGQNMPSLKTPAGSTNADALNAELAALNDEHAKLVATIANTVVGKPKKKKEIGVPYPGPGGMTVKQPASLAEARTAKGLNNLKDGYVPTPGMILRHNDGTQYAVFYMGSEWDSHKNSVYVAPVDNPYDLKWRALSTMVVDHDAMLTATDGTPLPIISEVDGTDWTPSGLLLRKDFTKGYYMPDPSGAKDAFGNPKQMYRNKDVSKFFVVAQDGTVYNLDGTQASTNAIQPGMPIERIGYIDKDHPGGQKLTVSIQQHHNAAVGEIQYAVIHDPNESAGIPLAQQYAVPAPTPPPPAAPTAPAAPNVPAAPGVPEAAPTPTTELPVYNGKTPTGMEMPHPATTSSSKGVPAYQATGAPATLDVVGVQGAHSVANAIAETQDKAKNNKGSNNPDWVGTYGMADHDVIEDMLVQTQVVRDGQGNDYVEVRFRVEADVARSNHTTFITSTTNETGDWKHDGRNATNLVIGDYLAVRVSGGGGATVKGALRPDGGLKDGPKTPNAQVIAPPVLIGKNTAGTFDVYRTQVMTAGGDIGFVDLEDRSAVEPESLYVSTWDPTIPRTSNGSKGLNPNAAADGWKVKAKQLQWDRADSGSGSKEQYGDGVKKSGDGANSISAGSGWTLQRDFQGAHVEYRTTDGKNSLDGQVSIRVPLDDPAAQQKIADAMELVGVSKEAQKPPDRAAVIKMATDKVWEQFNPTWTKGKRPNSPQQALDAIDAAVGPQLGRKATMDDISIRVTPDGRVQVLVSEDVSRAIVKKNGIKHYTHRFSTGGMENAAVGAIQGENPGLMSTTERWSHGLFYQGMSSVSDHSNDAAGYVFLRMSKSSNVGSGHAVVDAVTLHRHVDYYWQPNDTFGKRQSNQLNWLNDPSAGGSNELMLQRRLEVDLWSHIVVDPGTRQAYLDKLHKQGITHAPNGLALEDFFVTSGGTGALSKTPPTFGDEIPLSALPAGPPAATAVAPAAPTLVGV